MFYLTKRVDVKQCSLGDRCMALIDDYGITAGKKGRIVEISDEGVSIQWDKNSEGCRSTDDFDQGNLDCLAFETRTHPNVDPKVNRDMDALP